MVKTITIRDEVYGKLSTVKGKGESFSELLERLVEGMDPTKTLMKLRGCAEFKNKKKILAEIRSLRTERRL
ncbi:MAG: antitoxin VapB family protein [Candidatus Hodarchaeaceae archaeon]|nr:antitoxin VapB family protein [Candidatus Hodarchaeaceae archaeon]